MRIWYVVDGDGGAWSSAVIFKSRADAERAVEMYTKWGLMSKPGKDGKEKPVHAPFAHRLPYVIRTFQEVR